jgi:peptidoglycan lytic transglycosylase
MRRRIRCPVTAGLIGFLLGGASAGLAGSPGATGPLAGAAESRYESAIEALRGGDPQPALGALADVDRLPVADYLGYVRVEALLRNDDVAGARRAAESLAARFPDRRVGRAALLLAAELAGRAGDEARAEALLRRFLVNDPDSPEAPEALYLLGASFEAQGARENAAQTYRELTLLAPASDYAAGADGRLQALAQAGVTLPAPTLVEQLARAARLLRAGQAEMARTEAAQVAAVAPDRDLARQALAVAATALARQRRYEAAALVVQGALARAPDDDRPALALERGRLLYRADKLGAALEALEGVDDTQEAEAAEAEYLRGLVLEERGQLADAALAWERTVARYPARDVAASALWRLGWLAYLGGDPAGAAERWVRLRELRQGQRYRTQAGYWAGRARQQLGAGPQAVPLFEGVWAESPRGYYGILAAARLADSRPAPPAPSVQLPTDPARALAADPDYVRIEMLRQLGLPTFAADEIDDAVSRAVIDPVKLFWLAIACQQSGRYDLSLRIVRQHFSALIRSGHPATPRAFWETAYPIGWRTELRDAAGRAGLDPLLLAAIVREESSFYPAARSRAGARGLMQVLPQTAHMIAGRWGLAWKEGDLLDEPGPNLRIGAAMLADLLREFPDPRLAIAAYNAGVGTVRGWWSTRRTSDVEAFVEQMPYEETRGYVKRVVVSWEEYRRLYGSEPAR